MDGKTAQTGMKVAPGQEVRVGKRIVSGKDEMVVLAVNKPRGIVCTEEKREKNNIIRFLDYPVRVTYVGRLDKDSRGLLLMTNNGDIINRMMRAANCHEKEYRVTVDREVTEDFLPGGEGREIYLYHHPDPGAEPPDTQDVLCPRL